MNVASTVLLALAMSTDAFAAAVGKGAALHEPRWREALRTGVVFGPGAIRSGCWRLSRSAPASTRWPPA